MIRSECQSFKYSNHCKDEKVSISRTILHCKGKSSLHDKQQPTIQGPNMLIVASMLSLQSLRLGENESAIAAGVNLMLLGETTAAICQLQALSPVGRCKTFDASADGYGRGEGVAVAVLQKASNNNKKLAVLLGSAVNQVSKAWYLRRPSCSE